MSDCEKSSAEKELLTRPEDILNRQSHLENASREVDENTIKACQFLKKILPFIVKDEPLRVSLILAFHENKNKHFELALDIVKANADFDFVETKNSHEYAKLIIGYIINLTKRFSLDNFVAQDKKNDKATILIDFMKIAVACDDKNFEPFCFRFLIEHISATKGKIGYLNFLDAFRGCHDQDKKLSSSKSHDLVFAQADYFLESIIFISQETDESIREMDYVFYFLLINVIIAYVVAFQNQLTREFVERMKVDLQVVKGVYERVMDLFPLIARDFQSLSYSTLQGFEHAHHVIYGGQVKPSFGSATEVQTKLVVCKERLNIGKTMREEELEVYRILETPLPLPAMPSPDKIEAMELTLLSEFPWAFNVIERIFSDLCARALLGSPVLYFEPTLLVGLPGSGKSRLIHRIAEVLEITRLDIPLAGVNDATSLAGTSRGWSSSRPSDFVVHMAEKKKASMLVGLDEIDKISAGNQNGNVGSYLLSLLEPETSKMYRDHCIKVQCDLSRIIWLATANELGPISAPLKSRFRILMLHQPEREHFQVIANNVIQEIAQRWDVPAWSLPGADVLNIPYEMLKSAREVRRAVERAVTDHVLSMHGRKSKSNPGNAVKSSKGEYTQVQQTPASH